MYRRNELSHPGATDCGSRDKETASHTRTHSCLPIAPGEGHLSSLKHQSKVKEPAVLCNVVPGFGRGSEQVARREAGQNPGVVSVPTKLLFEGDRGCCQVAQQLLAGADPLQGAASAPSRFPAPHPFTYLQRSSRASTRGRPAPCRSPQPPFPLPESPSHGAGSISASPSPPLRSPLVNHPLARPRGRLVPGESGCVPSPSAHL